MLTFPWKKRRRSPGLAGIALAPDGIASAHVLRNEGELPRLLSCSYRPVGSGDYGPALEELARDQGLETVRCVSVLGEDQFNLLLVEAPEVDPTELKAAVRWRIKDLIDFHIDDAVIDVFDIPSQRNGRTRMMYVVAARAATVRKHIDLLEGAHLDLEIIDIPELVLRNIAGMLPEDATGVAVLYLTRQGGTLVLTRQSSLYLARTLDLGVDQLAREAEAAESEAAAEQGEMALEPREALPPGLQRLFDGIVLEVQRSLDYYESHFSLPPISGLVIAPMERPVPHLVGYVAGNLGVPVRMMDLNALFEVEQPLSDELQARCLPAIGAALRREEKSL